ncbi:MAG: hypothetical protein NXH85_07495 [Pseudomonadaceae bacterium]|nr:hypothetical protein [Pseudomonadaceae bacterium]
MKRIKLHLAALGIAALAAGCDDQATVATTPSVVDAPGQVADVQPVSFEASYAQAWGPAIGAPMPLLDAPDQNGDQRNLASLSGSHGLLLFLNRSADW